MTKQALDNIRSALAGNRDLLMKQKILQFGKNYTVMDINQTPLCFVRLDWGANAAGRMLSAFAGKWAGRMMKYTYKVSDATDQPALEIRKGSGSFKSYFDIIEPEGNERIGGIGLRRSLIGGMRAEWQDPASGQALIRTEGNVIRRKYRMVGSDGSEIATVRHKIAAIRDVWKLEIKTDTNHLHAVIFSAVLDFEKEM